MIRYYIIRKQGIRGSDVGAICGVNPYKSPFSVYVDKTDSKAGMEDTERLRQGRDLEAYVAKRFAESSGIRLHKTNYLYCHDEYPFMIADVDRVIAKEAADLECKTVSAFSADKWKSADRIPETYLLQCEHYMAVMNWDYMYLAGLILGSDFVYYRILEQLMHCQSSGELFETRSQIAPSWVDEKLDALYELLEIDDMDFDTVDRYENAISDLTNAVRLEGYRMGLRFGLAVLRESQGI